MLSILLRKELRRLSKLRDLYCEKADKSEIHGNYSEYLFYNMLYCRIVNDIECLALQEKNFKK